MAGTTHSFLMKFMQTRAFHRYFPWVRDRWDFGSGKSRYLCRKSTRHLSPRHFAMSSSNWFAREIAYRHLQAASRPMIWDTGQLTDLSYEEISQLRPGVLFPFLRNTCVCVHTNWATPEIRILFACSPGYPTPLNTRCVGWPSLAAQQLGFSRLLILYWWPLLPLKIETLELTRSLDRG